MKPYRERLWPSAWLFVATALVIPASLLVFLPINLAVGVATAVVLYGACVVLLLMSAPVIAVDGGILRAGRAHVPVDIIGETEAFRGEDARQERGPRLDARAWLLIRGWVDPVVRVRIEDPADPVPYWLISTRRPDELPAAIRSARAPRGG